MSIIPNQGFQKAQQLGRLYHSLFQAGPKVFVFENHSLYRKKKVFLASFSSSAEQELIGSLKTSELQDQPCVTPWDAEASQRPPCHTCISIYVFNQALDR